MDLLGSARNGYGKVLLDVVEGVFRDHSVPPNTTRSTRQAFPVWVTRHFHFFPGNPRTSHGNTVCESAQTDDCTGNHPRSTPSRCFAQRSSRARGLIKGWIQTALKNCVSPKKSHQRSQSTGCVLVRKAPTNIQASVPQVKGRWGLQRLPRQGVNVKSTWPGCEVKQVGDLSLFAIPLPHRSHTHPWMVIAGDREVPLWWCSTPRSVRRNHFSRHNGYSDGKEANSSPSSPRTWTTSARRITVYQKGSKSVAEQGELQGF